MSPRGRDVWAMTNERHVRESATRMRAAGDGSVGDATGRDGSEGYARVAWRGAGKRAEGRNVSSCIVSWLWGGGKAEGGL